MKRKTTKVSRVRLSPNEEAHFVREELDRRRKLRVQQVREQERYIALQIRHEVRERKEKELQNVAATLRDEWQQQRKEKIETLEKLHGDSLRAVGQGYRNAKQSEPDWDALARKRKENMEQAAGRHQQALRVLACQRQSEEDQRTRHIEARKKALIVEKKRAMKIANLPQPVPNPIESIGTQTPPTPSMAYVERFSITYCHVPETAVDREMETEQSDAQQAAKLEAQRLKELEREEVHDRQEQLEKARLRGGHALQKEKVIQDNARLLCELERLQQADLQQRRQVVNSIPAQIFQPLYRHDELRAEKQRELELAFQDLYSGEREVRGDLILKPVPEPLPAPSARSNDEDLDVTLDPEATPCEEAGEGEESAAPPSQRVVNSAQPTLQRLLERIRRQREQRSCRQFPAGRGKAVLENTSIETGSLSNQEWEHAPSSEQDTSDALYRTDSKLSVESSMEESIPRLEEQFTENSRKMQEKVFAPVSDSSQSQRLWNYQQRLLVQNRLKKKCVEDARRQLEEYQKKLQLCCSMKATQTQEPPLTEETCCVPSFADGEHSSAFTRTLVANADFPIPLYTPTVDITQSHHDLTPTESQTHADPVLFSQPSGQTTGSALATMSSVPSPAITTYACTPREVLNTHSFIPEQSLSLSFIQPAVSALSTSHTMQDCSMALVPLPEASSLSERRCRDGPFDMGENALPSVVLERLLSCTHHKPPALVPPQFPEVKVPLVGRPPAVVPSSGQTSTRPGQEEVMQNHLCMVQEMEKNQSVREQMRKQRSTLEALLREEHTEESFDLSDVPASRLTLMETLLKATEESNTLCPYFTPLIPLLEPNELCVCESGSGAQIRPPISRPPRMVQIHLQDLQPHELSTIQEVDTPANATQNTVSEDSLGPGSSSEVLMLQNNTCRASRPSWRETLQLESADSHTGECPIEQQHVEKLQLASLHDTDYMMSTTISTGSFSTSEHDNSQTVNGGSVSVVAAGESTVLNFNPGAKTMQQLLSTQCPMEYRDSFSTTLQDTFQPLSPEVTFNSMSECPTNLHLPVEAGLCCPPVGDSTTDPAASQWLDKTDPSLESDCLNPLEYLRSDAQSEHLQMSMEQIVISNDSCHDIEKVSDDHSASGPAVYHQWERVLKLDREKGILEESMISLVSLSDTTLEDDYPTCKEEKGGEKEIKENLEKRLSDTRNWKIN
ncbi:centrosomal protein of 295 kDa isoform X1 [Pygocentrus nattereri]|uniref:centrosomal protein of 295 kDa isoform X1 n=1 Tax=Pygocentrus nattereri TaxID=42514 RepID=UPI0008143A2F|nr:centrosomal protein of 295 kDa isoform X1 [Pygocentrus nattereri]